jgi:hypothetical protein
MKPNKPEMNERQDATSAAVFSNPLNGAMAEVFERNAAAFGKNIRTLHQESARFINKRAEENSNAMERFANCKSMPDVFFAQQQWFSDVTRAYNDEWMRFGELMGEMVQDSAAAENGASGMTNGRRIPD